MAVKHLAAAGIWMSPSQYPHYFGSMVQVDALWQPELSVLPGNICNAFQGVANIGADRLGVACCVCGRSSDGAVIRCSSSHCSMAFHPLCARNAGQYLAIRQTGNKTSYKAYCGQHSQQARARDAELGVSIEVRPHAASHPCMYPFPVPSFFPYPESSFLTLPSHVPNVLNLSSLALLVNCPIWCQGLPSRRHGILVSGKGIQTIHAWLCMPA